MAWMDGPIRTSTPTHGRVDPIAAVCHRTYGSVAGDLAVMQGARDGIGFHFLVGPSSGQWWQGASTDRKCWHAAGGNGWSVGIEVTGTNDDPFTDWQIEACGRIVGWLHATHSIPLVYYDSGREGRRAGFVAHNAIAGSDHGDRWGDNWERVLAAALEEKIDMAAIPVSVIQAIRMDPRSPGRGLKLDLLGGLHPIGSVTAPRDAPYWDEWPWETLGPVAVDFDVTDWDTDSGIPAGYTVDCKGGVHAWGGAPVPASSAYWEQSPWITEL